MQENQTLQRLFQLETLTGSPCKAGAKSGDRRKSKSNNNSAVKGKTAGKREVCSTCGKLHKGECWQKTGGGPSNKSKRTKLDKESLNMIAKLFGPTTKSDDKGILKEELPKAEKLFCDGCGITGSGLFWKRYQYRY